MSIKNHWLEFHDATIPEGLSAMAVFIVRRAFYAGACAALLEQHKKNADVEKLVDEVNNYSHEVVKHIDLLKETKDTYIEGYYAGATNQIDEDTAWEHSDARATLKGGDDE